MNQTLRAQITNSLDWLFPRVCYGCHTSHQPEQIPNLCIFCWENIAKIQRFKLMDTRVEVVSAGIYSDLLKKIVTQSKFKHHSMCIDFTFELIFSAFQKLPAKFDYVTSIPSNYFRCLWRGVDLPGMLAKEISRKSGIEFRTDFLKKGRRSHRQRTLNWIQRQQNVKNLYEASPEIRGKRLLIIDDIMTTGSTIKACHKALKRHKPAHIVFLTVAKT
ncbi:MAG: ComF family protein [Proteobacteria bacterium]|nr:ComF family protein [Pseudomonadota bacterium]